MAATPDHSRLDPDVQGIHCVHQYSFPDSASRTGAPASMLAGGASKLGLQRDTFGLYILSSVSPTPNWIQVGGSNLATGGSNLGSGIGVYDSTSGQNLQFRSLLGGCGINISQQASTIIITASAPSGINLGAGASIYHETAASKMQFKSLLPGPGINLSADASTITIEASAGNMANERERQFFPATAFSTGNGASYSDDSSGRFGWDLQPGSSHRILMHFFPKIDSSSLDVDIFWQSKVSDGSANLTLQLMRRYIFGETFPSPDSSSANGHFPTASNSTVTSVVNKTTFSEQVIDSSASDIMWMQISRLASSADDMASSIKIIGVSVY